jgi:hypothetical protein
MYRHTYILLWFECAMSQQAYVLKAWSHLVVLFWKVVELWKVGLGWRKQVTGDMSLGTFFSFIHLFICAYIVGEISPPCPPTPLLPGRTCSVGAVCYHGPFLLLPLSASWLPRSEKFSTTKPFHHNILPHHRFTNTESAFNGLKSFKL